MLAEVLEDVGQAREDISQQLWMSVRPCNSSASCYPPLSHMASSSIALACGKHPAAT